MKVCGMLITSTRKLGFLVGCCRSTSIRLLPIPPRQLCSLWSATRVYFRKEDMGTVDDLMLRVRASSTVPIIMPPPQVNGRYCYDGGFAVGGGLPLARIAADGFDRVFIVRTRKRGYRKEGSNSWANVFFWRCPAMRKAVLTRNARYNEACDMIDQWEREGRAYVFYCDDLTLSGNERDYDELCRNYESGRAQIKREWGRLMDFLERSEV